VLKTLETRGVGLEGVGVVSGALEATQEGRRLEGDEDKKGEGRVEVSLSFQETIANSAGPLLAKGPRLVNSLQQSLLSKSHPV